MCCIQQNTLLTLVSEKNGNSSICKSGRLHALLNQAYQFHADFYHHILITWLSAANLFFLPKQLGRQKSENHHFFQQAKPLLMNVPLFPITGYLH